MPLNLSNKIFIDTSKPKEHNPPMTTKLDKKWKGVCKSLTENIERTWGKSWKQLGEPLQYALIAEQVVHVFTGRPDDYPALPSKIHQYLEAMWIYHGLLTPADQES